MPASSSKPSSKKTISPPKSGAKTNIKPTTNDAVIDDEQPEQLTLFEIFDQNGKPQDRLSNTVEIYDALPKYHWSGKRVSTDIESSEIIRFATIRGVQYKIAISPALIGSGKNRVLMYPGEREEVVEDALRKMAVSGSGQFVEKNAGVKFTLGQLRDELKTMGHTYALKELREAILVCRGSIIDCYSADGETLVSGALFPMVALTSRSQYLSEKSDARCFVMFNPLVTKSIMDLSFRQYNYKLGMAINSPLARFIYKRMSHYWVQASHMAPYTPSLIAFLQQSPRGVSESIYTNIRAMKHALDLLIKHHVISEYTAEEIRDKRKIVDVRYVIRPHEDFVKAAKAANYQSNKIKQLGAAKTAITHMKDTLDKPGR